MTAEENNLEATLIEPDDVGATPMQKPESTEITLAEPEPIRQPAIIESQRKQSRSLPTPIRYLLSILILAAAAAGCYGLAMLAKPTASREATALIPKVNLQNVDAHAGSIDLIVSGTVVPHQEINIAAEVNGRVWKKYPDCLAGNFVTKGTPLIQIDPESYKLEVETINAELVQADKRIAEIDQQITGEQESLQIAQSDLTLQNNELERSKRLGRAITPSELDQAQRGVNTARSQVTLRENTIRTLQATRETSVAARALTESRLAKAKLDLKRTKIVAPTDGLIVAENVQQDGFVRQGEPVLQFENTEIAEVRCNLTTTDLDWIRMHSKDDESARSIYQLPKTDVVIFDAAEPEVEWSGELERFSGIGRDPITKTIPCRILVKSPVAYANNDNSKPRALVRGMYVKCKIAVQISASDDYNNLMSFSDRALQPNGDVWFVRDEKLMKATVEVVDRTSIMNENTEKTETTIIARVTSGSLVPGDKVVVSPLSQPTEDTKVEIAKPTEETIDD